MSTPKPETEASAEGRRAWRADLLLLLAALIWGSGFVAQRSASAHLGPFTFNAARNVLAALALLPFVLRWGGPARLWGPGARDTWRGGLAAGLPLFAGGWLQQAGLAHTTAGNAGFITGLYVVLVPLLAALAGVRLARSTWIAAALATAGLYLLSATDRGTLGRGDLLVLGSAVFWALHVHAIGHYSRRLGGLWLTWLQLVVAGGLSVPVALLAEPAGGWAAATGPALPAILYAGLVCGAFAFVLQVVGQRHAPAAHAAILMSLESVFAALFGGILLGERLGARGLAGAGLMLAGMVASQASLLRPRLTLPAGGAPSADSGASNPGKERNEPWA